LKAAAIAVFACLPLCLIHAQTSIHGPIAWTAYQDGTTDSLDSNNPNCHWDGFACTQDGTKTLAQMTITRPISIRGIDYNAAFQPFQENFDANGGGSFGPCTIPPHITVTDGTHSASLTLATGSGPDSPGYIQPHDTTGPIAVTMSANTTVKLVFDYGNPSTDGYTQGTYPANSNCFSNGSLNPGSGNITAGGTVTVQYVVQ